MTPTAPHGPLTRLARSQAPDPLSAHTEPGAQPAGGASPTARGTLMTTTDLITILRHDVDVDVELEHRRRLALDGAHSGAGSIQFDMAGARTVVGPGENCLVCDDPLVVGDVFVLGTWDGSSGPAHEDCPVVLDGLLSNLSIDAGQDEDV